MGKKEILTSSNTLTAINLQEIPLPWAKMARHYFENEYREYWISTILDNKLLFSGLDIDFQEISLDYEEAVIERDKLLMQLLLDKGVKCFKGIIINKPEMFWILSVLESSLGCELKSEKNIEGLSA